MLIIVPILIGVAVVAYNVRNRAEPQRTDTGEAARKVRIITVPATTVVPRALGFGTVTPGTVWQAVAEVQGTVIEIHAQLKSGSILPKGTTLLRIDPADYRLALRSVEADIGVIRAQLAELAGRRTNTRASLAIEDRLLAIAVFYAYFRPTADCGTYSREMTHPDLREACQHRPRPSPKYQP